MERRRRRALATAICMGGLFLAKPAGALSSGKRIMLVFSIEQGFVNSPVQNEDVVALGRVAATLAGLKGRYDVFVTLGCAQSDQGKLLKALDVFSASRVPFFFDVWSSDNMAPPRPANNPVSRPYDKSHGLCQSTKYLQTIKNRYGASFAGIRLHEVFAANLSVSMFHMGKDWFPHTSPAYPSGAYFTAQILDDEFRFAYRNGMKVIFSDPYWLEGGNHFLKGPGVYQARNEEILADALRRYPNTGIVMYANNEPLKGGADPLYKRINDWSSLFPPSVMQGAIRFGLSDQAWVCDRAKIPEAQCEPRVVADWADKAIRQGASAFEFEPYWYFFNFPRPAGDRNDYAARGDAGARGTTTNNFDVLIRTLDRAARP